MASVVRMSIYHLRIALFINTFGQGKGKKGLEPIALVCLQRSVELKENLFNKILNFTLEYYSLVKLGPIEPTISHDLILLCLGKINHKDRRFLADYAD